MFRTFLENVQHNLFKPLLLFFYMGFLVPILRVEFEFPHVIYQGLTIYLLVSIGWHGGEELAKLDNTILPQALKFMSLGFVTNFIIGIVAYMLIRAFTRLRRADAATVAGFEMGMTASRKLRDLKRGGVPFIILGIVMPILFATTGIAVAHVFSMVIHQELTLGTYVLFSVLCGASSYIAVPAVQRLAIPEASPTLPLAASLGLTFSFNVTLGIPLSIEVAKALRKAFPAA